MGDRPLSDRPLPSSFDENEDFYNQNALQKITRKVKQEPLIPLGCLLTVAAFANAYRAMRKGDHAQVQRMFRARVLAQGFTVIAIAAGGIYFGNERHKERELWKIQQEQDSEEKRQRWIKELEARDEEEKALRERLERRRKKTTAPSVVENKTIAQEIEANAEPSTADKKANTSSLLSLGAWFGSEKPADAPGPELHGEGKRAAAAAAAAQSEEASKAAKK